MRRNIKRVTWAALAAQTPWYNRANTEPQVPTQCHSTRPLCLMFNQWQQIGTLSPALLEGLFQRGFFKASLWALALFFFLTLATRWTQRVLKFVRNPRPLSLGCISHKVLIAYREALVDINGRSNYGALQRATEWLKLHEISSRQKMIYLHTSMTLEVVIV